VSAQKNPWASLPTERRMVRVDMASKGYSFAKQAGFLAKSMEI
jgi:hypothetical protein